MIPGSTPTMGNDLTGRPAVKAAIALAPFACARNLICANLSNHRLCILSNRRRPHPPAIFLNSAGKLSYSATLCYAETRFRPPRFIFGRRRADLLP